MIQDKVASYILILLKYYLIVNDVAGPRTNQNPEHEAGRAAGGAPDQRGHGGERHLLPQRQAVRGEVVMYHKDYTICSKYKHLCQGFLSSDLIKVTCQSICSP